ncbi:MAG: LytR/AlgR family response regulator transcription factor [Lachnotalea sp.]
MKIAIVDDEQKERALLSEYIEQYASQTGIKLETLVFDSGDAILNGYKVSFDIIIFDIDMPGTNGMDTAKRIRLIDKQVTILFVTNIAQYAIDGYAVEAVDYIIKPIGYYEFSMKFQRAIGRAVQKKTHVIVIDTVEGIRHIKTSEVLYVEVMSHYLIFHTEDTVYKTRGSMKEQKEVLMPYHFCRVHKSYLVNLERVEEIQTKSVLVKGEEVPLGRIYKDDLLQEYMKYIRG